MTENVHYKIYRHWWNSHWLNLYKLKTRNEFSQYGKMDGACWCCLYVHHLQVHPSCASVSAFIRPGNDQKHELTFTRESWESWPGPAISHSPGIRVNTQWGQFMAWWNSYKYLERKERKGKSTQKKVAVMRIFRSIDTRNRFCFIY